MEVLYLKRLNFAIIRLTKNYCKLSDKKFLTELNTIDNKLEKSEHNAELDEFLDVNEIFTDKISPYTQEYIKLSPKIKNRKTKYFHSDKNEYVKVLAIMLKNNKFFYTDKDKHIKNHYNNPFAAITIETIERKIILNGDKLTVKFYHQSKFRNFNSIYFNKTSIITSITLNLKSGDITTVEFTKRTGKPQTKRIRKNCFDVLYNILISKSLINQFGLVDVEYKNYVKDFFNDAEFFSIMKNCFNDDSIIDNSTFLQTLMKNFIKIKNYKLPDNFYWIMPLLFYPNSKLLKKNKNNLYNSILDLFKIKSKSTIKIVNQYPKINVHKLAYICFMFGENYGKYVNQLSDDTLHNLTFDSIHNNEGINVYYKRGYFATIFRFNNILLSPRDKKHLVEFLNNTSPDGSFIPSYTNFVFLLDHFDMLTKLRSYGINIHMEAKNNDEIHNEHLLLSQKMQDVRREFYLSRVFYHDMLSDIESKMTVNHITVNEETNERVIQAYEFSPVVLKDELEYKEEGEYMHHCVATYVDRMDSIIISIRDSSSKHRVTCEFSTEDGELRQARHFCNQNPPPEFEQAISRLTAKVIIHARKNKLKPIEIIKIKNENYILEAKTNEDFLYLPFV